MHRYSYLSNFYFILCTKHAFIYLTNFIYYFVLVIFIGAIDLLNLRHNDAMLVELIC